MLTFNNVEQLSDIFTNMHLLLYFVISGLNTLLLLMISYKFLQIMQQSGYEGFGYFKWLRRRDNIYLIRLGIVTMLSLLAYLLVNITLSFINGDWVFFIGIFLYIMFIFGYYNADKKRVKKVRLVYTSRMIRLIVSYIFVLYVVSFSLIVGINILAFYLKDVCPLIVRIRYFVICGTPILVPVLVLIAYYITKPYERANQRKFIKECKQTLADHPNLIKIGITGSYGKTTVKGILTTMLEEKYRVLSTPRSYNTPLGICRSVKRLKPEHEIFIAEMGARQVGDIRELAEIIKPDYAIINGVVNQHLESFGSLGAIIQTKFELVESMESGVAAYTVDNENTIEMMKKCKIRAIPTGISLDKSPEVYAKDIEIDHSGSSFTLVANGEEERCYTNLLGKHNISNICLAASIALELGLSLGEISAAISRLTAVNHRLQVTENSRGVTIIDDSYNSNPVGARAALDVLKMFSGRKIIVTPGMVELGREQDMENFILGKEMSSACDVAILVGKSSAYQIRDGLIECGFNNDNIILVPDLPHAKKELKKMLKDNDVVLFENDLPDKFS